MLPAGAGAAGQPLLPIGVSTIQAAHVIRYLSFGRFRLTAIGLPCLNGDFRDA
jgi:hypothetical protein